MLKNHIKLILRTILKRKGYSFINIFGLSIGMAVCLIILQYVQFELSYDKFHVNGDRVYRTISASYTGDEFNGNFPLSGSAQGPSMMDDYPEVEMFCRIHPQYGGAVLSTTIDGTINQFFEESMYFVDSTFFEMFTFQSLAGDLKTSLRNPMSIVLSEEMALKYFNNINVVGEEIEINGGWAEGIYTVKAVLQSVPQNSHLEFDFLLSIHDLLTNGQYTQDSGWGWSNFLTYVMLNPKNQPKNLEAKLPEFVQKYEGEDLAERNGNYIITLQLIKDIHLTTGFSEEQATTGSSTTVYAFSIIALFILVIAWVNYINLSTARATERAREVGIKKVVGAGKGQLITQFLLESAFLNGIAVIIAVTLSLMILPALGNVVGKNLVFDLNENPMFWVVIATMVITGTIFSGLYPAFVLSSFKSSAVLKTSEGSKGGLLLRRILVVFQFGASLALIAGTLTVYKQISFMRDQDLGMNLDQVLVVHGPRSLPDETNHTDIFGSFKTELLRYPSISNIASSGTVPGGGFNWGTSFRKLGTEPGDAESGHVTFVDSAFIDTYDLTIIAGRKWNMELESDRGMVMVNEAALYAYDLGSPDEALEQKLIVGGDTIGILGVLQNFHWSSLKTSRESILLAPARSQSSYYSIKLDSKDLNQSIQEVEAKYNEFFPGNPYDYFFMDDFFNKQYNADMQFGKLFSMFAVLAILIGCLGLSGLASFTVTQRTKEIGVRKVLGASIHSIVVLLSGRFLLLILISSGISIPFVYVGITQWLKGYAFPIGIGWDLLAIPVGILLTIAALTVSMQSIKAAVMNPARSLKTE